ncbi:MAG: hypothetical protein RLO51_02565 [Thalassobaculum sp.]|uniref:hypothetical protein n=1 Tax=Thalassobaculum sp. TaxID=2022740 RepID=UPI0032EBB9EE
MTIEATAEEASDRIVIHLDPGGPIELHDLTSSFAALARYYERHYPPSGEPPPKLYVTKLTTGSVYAEIVPYALFMGQIIVAMDHAVIVADFTRRLSAGIKAFSDPTRVERDVTQSVTRDDAADLKNFIKPIAGKTGSSLGIKHARFRKTTGDEETVAEYIFSEPEINRAAINIDQAIAGDEQPLMLESEIEPSTKPAAEVMLFFEQASRKPGKETGRTGDRGIIPDISDKALPVYFRKSFQSLKDQMVRGDVNPLANAFVVDTHVQWIAGEPRAYIVTAVHEVVPLDDPEESPRLA